MSIAQEVSAFFTQKTKPHYLSHAVRALSDHIDNELQQFILKEKQQYIKQIGDSGKEKELEIKKFKSLRQLFYNKVLRLFEIKLVPNEYLDTPARVRIIRLEKNSKSLYGHFVAKIEYDPQAFDMQRDEDAEKKLRFLIAHELGHIFIFRGQFLEILKHYVKKLDEMLVFSSQNLEPDHDEEIKAWQFALALIHHKDQFYHKAPEKFCYCCQDKIFNVCFDELIGHVGARNKLRRYYLGLKNDKKIVSCEKCSK